VNTTNLAALITAITGAVGAVTALIIAVRHVINHDAVAPQKPVDSPRNPLPKRPANPGKTTL